MFGTTFIKDNWDDLTSLGFALGLTGWLYSQIDGAALIGLVATICVFVTLGSLGLHVASRLVPSIKDEVAKAFGGLFSSN